MKKGWEEDTNRILYHKNFAYILNIVQTDLISRHYDNLLAEYFEIEKTRDPIVG